MIMEFNDKDIQEIVDVLVSSSVSYKEVNILETFYRNEAKNILEIFLEENKNSFTKEGYKKILEMKQDLIEELTHIYMEEELLDSLYLTDLAKELIDRVK